MVQSTICFAVVKAVLGRTSLIFSPYRSTTSTGTRDYHRKRRMFEGHCLRRVHFVYCFKTVVFFSYVG